jgi:hypothetical protein
MSAREFLRCGECRALNEPRALFCSRCGASLYGPLHGGPRRKPRRATAAGAAMGFAVLLVLATCIFLLAVVIGRTLSTPEEVDVFAGQSGTTATIATATTETETTEFTGTTDVSGAGSTGTTEIAVQIRPTAAAASSTLEPTQTNSYGVTNLLDGDVTTAWNEGSDGNGIGEWVQFNFSQDVVLSRIEIANGYQKDDDRFSGNPRVQSIKVEYSNGTSQLVDLLDSKEMQIITPTRQPITSLRIVIVSVYPGTEWDDTALSEVRFWEAAK